MSIALLARCKNDSLVERDQIPLFRLTAPSQVGPANDERPWQRVEKQRMKPPNQAQSTSFTL